MSNKIVNKKRALLARKEQILKELRYYDKRIEDVKNEKKTSKFYDDNSSDSEVEITIDLGTSVTELRMKESKMQTCLQATEELTDLQILQSEVNVMVNQPDFEGGSSVIEDGTWREVTVECKIDLVSFSLSFYTHQAERPFAPISYRNLRVTPIKAVHENELSRSVLPSLTTPSDAIEVLRSYAAAHRSRRSTLAKLSEKYADALFMEPLPDGGYALKCGSLLQVSWTLQNKWSPIAQFHHKMTFDLEYMDESYVKAIMQAHRQLGDPSVDTDERTLLLASIIDTCLEAQKYVDQPSESMDSDMESQMSKRLQTSDQETESILKDSEIMGPPKSLPKKSKPKGKENAVANNSSSRKRSNDDFGASSYKKAKTNANTDDNDAITENNDRQCDTDNVDKRGETTRTKEMSSKNLQANMNAKSSEGSKNEKLSVEKDTNAKPKVNNKNNINKDDALVKSSTNKVANTKSNNVPKKATNENIPEKVSGTKAKISKKKADIVNNNDHVAEKSSSNNVASTKGNKNETNLNGNNNLQDNPIKGNSNKEKKSSAKTNSTESKKANTNNKDIAIQEKGEEINVEKQMPSKKKSEALLNKENPIKPITKSSHKNVIDDQNGLIAKKNTETNQSSSTKTKTQSNVNTNDHNIEKNLKSLNNKQNLNKIKNKARNNADNEPEMNKIKTKKATRKASTTIIDENIKKSGKTAKNATKDKEMLADNQITDKRNENVKNKKPLNIADKNQNLKDSGQNRNAKESSNNITKKGHKITLEEFNNKWSTLSERFSATNVNPKNNLYNSNKLDMVENKKKDTDHKNNKKSTKTDENPLEPNTENKISDKINKLINIESNVSEKIATNTKLNHHTVKNNLKTNNIFNKARKSIGHLTKKVSNNVIKSVFKEYKENSKIPQKRFSNSGGVKKNPLRISPRKLQTKLSSTQDSSKSSTRSLEQRTNIPRLLKKPSMKPKK